MSQSQLLVHTIQALEKTSGGYMLTGSLVSSMQGEPRATHDIDIVVEISPDDIDVLLAEFPSDDYCYDFDTAKQAIGVGGMFNILSIASGDKVDIWLLTDSAFDQSRFSRRQLVKSG
jgi:predicted nucleotidyltransferase